MNYASICPLALAYPNQHCGSGGALAPPISPDLKHVLQGSWCTQGDSIGEHAERLQPGFEPDPN